MMEYEKPMAEYIDFTTENVTADEVIGGGGGDESNNIEW